MKHPRLKGHSLSMGDRNDSKKQKNGISLTKFLETPRHGPQNTEIITIVVK